MSQGADWSREPETNTPQCRISEFGSEMGPETRRENLRRALQISTTLQAMQNLPTVLSIPIVIVSLVCYIYQMYPCVVYLPNVTDSSCFSKKNRSARIGGETPRYFCNGWHPNMSRYLHALNFETKMIHKKWNTWNQSPNANQKKKRPLLDVLSANGWRYLMYLRDLDPTIR